MRRIAAHYLISRGEIIPRPVITLNDEGCIISIDEWQRLDTLAQTEFYAGALCAGFVNAHSHIELSYLRGAIERGSGFAGFARQIGAVRGNFTLEEREQALRAADAAMWAQGVNAVADIANGATSMPMKAQSPIRYTTFGEVFGLNSTLEPMAALKAEWPEVILTPHSTYSLQEGLFRQTVEAEQKADAPLSIHFMESESEAALYRGEGSLNDWYERMGWRCDFMNYGSPTRRIIESVPATRRVLLVHNCYVGREDIEQLLGHFGDRVSWVVCPASNDFISGIKPPIDLLREMGCRICIGSDSLASNDRLSIIGEMKYFMDIPLRELLTWATRNGAEALGLQAELGDVEVGRRSGIVLLEGITSDNKGELWLTEQTTSRRLV
jgi:cytosine/adenosine deaminase-related metal-dependent hydrolase